MARRDTVRMLRRLEKAIEPPPARKARRKKAAPRARGAVGGAGI